MVGAHRPYTVHTQSERVCQCGGRVCVLGGRQGLVRR